MSTLIRGTREVRAAVVALLEANFPPALAAFRAEHGLKTIQLPPPVKCYPYEAETLDRLPVTAIAVGRVARFRLVDLEPGAVESYEIRYPLRIFAWLKDKELEPTQQLRDDYATVLGSVLLATPSLTPNVQPGDTVAPRKFRLDETTMELSFSDTQRVRGDRYVAGVSVNVDVLHRESLRRVPIGAAEGLTVEASLLPRHPGNE